MNKKAVLLAVQKQFESSNGKSRRKNKKNFSQEAISKNLFTISLAKTRLNYGILKTEIKEKISIISLCLFASSKKRCIFAPANREVP